MEPAIPPVWLISSFGDGVKYFFDEIVKSTISSSSRFVTI